VETESDPGVLLDFVRVRKGLVVSLSFVLLVVVKLENVRLLGARRTIGALLVLPGVVGHCVCRPTVLRFLIGEVLASSDLLIRIGIFCPSVASLAMAATEDGSEPFGTLTRILTFCFPSDGVAVDAAAAAAEGGSTAPASLAAFLAATLAL